MGVNLVRQIDPGFLEAVSKSLFYPVLLVHIAWPLAPIWAHSNTGTILFDGREWEGVGGFGEVRLPQEALGLASASASVSLYGLNDRLDDYLDDDVRGREARVYFGVVTERSGNVLIGTPLTAFTGYVDSMRDVTEVRDDILVRGVQIGLAQGPSQRQAGEFYHTYEDQIRAYPGDTAGRFAINSEAEAAKLTWPA